jgi:hypothetical protein
LLNRTDTAADPSDEPLLRKNREVATNGDLRNGKCFRKFRNRNVIPRLEQQEHVPQPLGLGQIPEID